MLYSLNQHFLAVYNVDTSLCDLCNATAREVVDYSVLSLSINTLDSSLLSYSECECSTSVLLAIGSLDGDFRVLFPRYK